MQVKSLGYRTDLFFHAFGGEIVDRGDYLVIRTPSNPGYYWGNFLLMAQPPQEGDFQRWRDRFTVEINPPPEFDHLVFGWDAPEGDTGVCQPFLDAGFRLYTGVVMTSSAPRSPSRPSDQVSIRALHVDADWAQAIEMQVICREPELSEAEYRTFRTQKMERYRMMAEAGLGGWFGASIDGQIVASLGIFHEDGIARFQHVVTHPDFRRRGIASTLVYQASHQAIEKYDLHTLVIVAEEGSSAARIYGSLGFQATEKQVGVEWWPEMD